MTELRPEDLRGLLFGEGPFWRHGAPEPLLLGDLALVLPESVLKEAIDAIAMIGVIDEGERGRVLAKLLGQLPEPDDDEVLVEHLVHRPRVAPYLSERLVERALSRMTAEVSEHGSWAAALVGLADRLPDEEARGTLLAALLTTTMKANTDYRHRCEFLTLVGHQRGPLPEQEARVLLDFIRLLDAADQVEAYNGLIPALAEPQRADAISRVMILVRDLGSAQEKAAALLRVAPYLDQAKLAEVLSGTYSLITSIEADRRQRAFLLCELSLRSTGAAADEAMAEARRPYEQGEITWPSCDQVILNCFADLASRGDRTLKPGLRKRVPGLTIEDTVNSALLPYLSEAQLAVAVTQIPDLPWDFPPEFGSSNLATLVPYLSEDHLRQAITVAAERVERESIQAQILMTLAGALSPTLASEALAVARRLEENWWRWRALEALQPRLPAEQRAELSAEFTSISSEVLCSLFRRQTAEEQLGIVKELIAGVWDYYGGAGPPEEAAVGHDDGAGGRDPFASSGFDAPVEVPESAREGAGHSFGLRDILREVLTRKAPSPEPARSFVNTGFADKPLPARGLPATSLLVPGGEYYFWVEIGKRLREAIDVDTASLPQDLPARAHLTIALFGFDDGIVVHRHADLGEICLQPDGTGRVTRPVSEPGPPGQDLLARRLIFPVTMPARTGTHQLRCNIYYEQVLLQSHLVEATVAGRLGHWLKSWWRPGKPTLATVCDYKLCSMPSADALEALAPHRFSIMLNDNGNGTHGFRFLGADGEGVVKDDATFDVLELQEYIETARKQMRKASWDAPTPWNGEEPRYDESLDLERLRADLVRFAKWGYRFYDALIGRLVGPESADAAQLRDAKRRCKRMMLEPGFVQLASKQTARHVVPLALIYDYGLDTTAPAADYNLCPAFLKAIDSGTPLVDTECFRGSCPSLGADRVVCPSGFWGYRHSIGLPVSVTGKNMDAAFAIRVDGAPTLAVAVSTDPNFTMRASHEDTIEDLDGVRCLHAESRQEAVELMHSADPHVMYFYCHGGIFEGMPYIEVGDPDDQEFITSDYLELKDVFWSRPRPLVFINGCHTTAVEPEQALNLVQGFVEANAAGVIGTEVTIFEPLAVAFGEDCLRRFLSGEPIGSAVRDSRLKLLQAGNPLGLVYIPFAPASLYLADDSR